MQDERFECDDDKAKTNLQKHRIDFADARRVFDDPGALDDLDESADYDEERFRAVGMVNGRLITVFYACEGRGSGSSRHASRHEPSEKNMPRRTRRSRAAIGPGKTDWAGLDAMSDEEAEAAALSDPDAPPLAPGQGMHSLAKVKRLRLALNLSREDFAERYHIPLEIVTRWERYEVEPDAVAAAFLDATAADPLGIAKALASSAAAE